MAHKKGTTTVSREPSGIKSVIVCGAEIHCSAARGVEESGQLLQVELNYNEHDLRDETWKLHEEMCFAAAGALMPDLGVKELASLCRELNALAAEKIVPHEEHFGKGMVPGVLICHNGIGAYPYFAVGSRSHFCLIPVDEKTILKYQEIGTEIRQQ